MVDKSDQEIQKLFKERLRMGGRNMSAQARKAGRLLPRHIRSDVRRIEETDLHMQHPKLRVMADENGAYQARKRVAAHLKTIDPNERRKSQLLSIAGSVSFSLLTVAGIFITVLVLRGFV